MTSSAADLAATVRHYLNSWKHDGGCMIFLPSGVCTCEPADASKPLAALDALVARCEQLERERDRLKVWQKAYAKGRAGLVEQAAQDFARAEAAERQVAELEANL